MGKKKGPSGAKKQVVSLVDFLGDDAPVSSNWGEVEDLPAAPVAYLDEGGADYDNRGPGGGGRWENNRGGNDRGGYQPREPRPQPSLDDLSTSPPFKAFIGNLDFNVQEEDVIDFFKMEIVSYNPVVHDGRPKGYGFVEFNSFEDLKKAMSMDGSELMGRSVRVSPPAKNDQGDRRGNSNSQFSRINPEDEGKNWRDLPKFTQTPQNNDGNRGGYGRQDSRGGYDRQDNRGGYGDRGDRNDRGPPEEKFRGHFGKEEPPQQQYQQSSRGHGNYNRQGSRDRPARDPSQPIQKSYGGDSATAVKKENPFGDARPMDAEREAKLAAKLEKLRLMAEEEEKNKQK